MSDYFRNAWLCFRHWLFKRILRKHDFGNPLFTEDFYHPTFSVSDRDLTSPDMITLKDNVEVKAGKLLLHVRHENKEFSNWWGTKIIAWSIGSIDFKNKAYPFGIWSVKCKLPNDINGWPAIWLLRERHPEAVTKIDLGKGQKTSWNELFLPDWINQRVELNWYAWYENTVIGFISAVDRANQRITIDREVTGLQEKIIFVSPDHITPEVDLMEIIHGKIQQTVHFGYSSQVYKTDEWNVKRGKPVFNREYEFSVEITKTGYKFYIDRILTGVLTKKNSISEAPAYLIINNAKQEGITTGQNSVFEISWIGFYKR